jgi:cyanophycinase
VEELMRGLSLALVAALTACVSQAPAPSQPGTVVIVGGGLSDDNADVWSAFAEAAKPSGPVVIVPAASGYPTESGDFAKAAMIQIGLAEDRIRIAPLAVMDDPTTDDVDESLWADNATDPELVAILEHAAAFWFTGGDQRRITQLLIDTPALDAIRKAHASGTGLGGTSAGAAMMSDTMITGGFRDGDESTPLTIDRGLGFLSGVIIDQHFSERNRLWRLQEAVDRSSLSLGLGIDENTAIIGSSHQMRVAGRGNVYEVSEDSVTVYASGDMISIHDKDAP